MDGFLNKAKAALSGSGSSSAQTGQQAGQQPVQGGAAPGQKDDYVDKAFAAGSKHFGLNTSRENQEKLTDAGRGFYEKSTGSKIDPKYSN